MVDQSTFKSEIEEIKQYSSKKEKLLSVIISFDNSKRRVRNILENDEDILERMGGNDCQKKRRIIDEALMIFCKFDSLPKNGCMIFVGDVLTNNGKKKHICKWLEPDFKIEDEFYCSFGKTFHTELENDED